MQQRNGDDPYTAIGVFHADGCAIGERHVKAVSSEDLEWPADGLELHFGDTRIGSVLEDISEHVFQNRSDIGGKVAGNGVSVIKKVWAEVFHSENMVEVVVRIKDGIHLFYVRPHGLIPEVWPRIYKEVETIDLDVHGAA